MPMPTLTSGPCTSWAELSDICGTCVPYVDSDPDELESLLEVASEILYMMSGRQFPGQCTRTIRPCAQYVSIPPNFRAITTADTSRYPRLWNGYCSCNRSRQCGCTRLSEINLGNQRVTSITSVKVDGEVVSSSLYELVDHHWLRRLLNADGTNPGWPCCQRDDLPDSQPDTFSVTFVGGFAPPVSGVKAAAALACQLFLLCNPGTGACQLPSNLSSLSRQGVGISVDSLSFIHALDNNRTGIAEVDIFLGTFAPKGNGWGGVLSPDTNQSRYRIVG